MFFQLHVTRHRHILFPQLSRSYSQDHRHTHNKLKHCFWLMNFLPMAHMLDRFRQTFPACNSFLPYSRNLQKRASNCSQKPCHDAWHNESQFPFFFRRLNDLKSINTKLKSSAFIIARREFRRYSWLSRRPSR